MLRQPGEPPNSFADWERHLVDYFLQVGPNGDASDIHSFEVTRDTLAEACGAPSENGGEVEAAFHRVLSNDPDLRRALIHGSQQLSTAELPNFFTYLVLTLFIDSLVDGEHTEFRDKLADWLGSAGRFVSLKGVAFMWERLEDWLNRRVKSGAPYRRLVLPEPGAWNNIGYTLRLSFPNRKDVRLIERFLSESGKEASRPAYVVNALQPFLAREGVSIGLKDAFSDFERSYYRNRRALADHRFWRFYSRIHSEWEADAPKAPPIYLSFGEDGEFEFLAEQTPENARSYVSLSSALTATQAAKCPDIGPAAKRGILFFRQVGLGKWQAEPHLKRCIGHIYVAVSTNLQNSISGKLSPLASVGGWLITAQPWSKHKVEDALKLVFPHYSSAEQIFRPAATNGIRVKGAWLGLPRFLPTIETDTVDVVIKCGEARSAEVRLSSSGQLESDAPLQGTFMIEPTLGAAEQAVPWRLRVQFVDRAVPHAKLGGARVYLDALSDWIDSVPRCVAVDSGDIFEWESGCEAANDLLEAIYADGASGWEEADLVNLVRRAGPEIAANPWEMLRCLHDAGIIQPRLRSGWRGKAWTLTPPRIVLLRHGEEELAVIEGALCARLVDAFQMAAEGAGGHAFKRLGAGNWSPPIIGAARARSTEIAELLGWPVVDATDEPGALPLALATTERHAEFYRRRSTWDWEAKRFVSVDAKLGTVRLVRLVHQGERDHDVYRLESRGYAQHFLSRTAAIAAAHAAARVPLFDFRGDRLVRTAQEGGLPDVTAAALRRRQLRNAGISFGEYVYPASSIDAKWLSILLPGCISGIAQHAHPSAGQINSEARRSMGRWRPQWRQGRLGS